MKPLKLTMSAFGSYAGVEVIAFDRVDRGIFLITGDTGAGKTTIFDAIVYALYDDTSGGKRDGDMMRSQYALPDVETYVELTFLCRGVPYTIRRNPNFTRTSKRKDAEGKVKLTEQKARVALIMPDGTEWPGNRTVINQKIVELIGLDRAQFTKTAMLAQGDFIELLQANSDERKKIFSKIFDTRLYQTLQNKLSDRASVLRQELEVLETEVQSALRQIEGIAETGYETEWQELLSQSQTRRQELVALAEQVNMELTRFQAQQKAEQARLEEQHKQALRREEQGRQINEHFAALQQAKQAKAELDARQGEQQARRAQINGARRCQEVIGYETAYQKGKQEVTSLEQQLTDTKKTFQQAQRQAETAERQQAACEAAYKQEYAPLLQKRNRLQEMEPLFLQLEQEKNNVQAIRKQQKQLEQAQAKYIQDARQLEQEKQTLQTQMEQCSSAPVRQLELEQEITQLKEQGSKKQNLYLKLKNWSIKKVEWETALKARNQSVEQDNRATAQYNTLSDIWVQEQAGILAADLQEGIPCPVCGSLTHPKKAACSQKNISQAQVEAARAASEQARLFREKQEKEFASVNDAYQELTGQIRSEGSEITGSRYEPQEADIAVFYRDVREMGDQLKRLEEQLKVARKDVAFYQQGQQTRKNQEEKLQQISIAQDTIQQQLTEVSAQAGAAQAMVASIQERLVYQETPEETPSPITQSEAVQKQQGITESLHRLDVDLERTRRQAKECAEYQNKWAGKVETSEIQLIKCRAEYEAGKQAYMQALAEHGFAEEAVYQSSKRTAAELQQLEEDCTAYENECGRIQERIEHLQQKTAGKQPVDLQKLGQLTGELEGRRKQTEQSINRLGSMIDGNNKQLTQLKEKAEAGKKLGKQYDMVSDLARTVSGNLVGSGRIGLETYVQRYYFQEVLQAANQRLMQMNGRQFLLQCRSLDHLAGNTNVGLDIDVYSLVTDSVRDVKTLSGGESFMAALAMALGLSDVIQGRAGAVQLDTMFIDEGFGSLDEESRGQAIAILNQLSDGNRLIGIISHVRELKEQLDRQLVVKRTKSGSQSSWKLE